MKKKIIATFLIVFNLIFISVRAQIKLTPTQVKEILVHNAVAGLGGGSSADVEVVSEAGKWNSYLIRKESNSIEPRRKSYDSTFHNFIAVLSPAVVNNLLNGIAVIKPAITASTFSLTPNRLITELKNGAKLPITDAPDFEKFLTPKAINEAISKTIVPMNVMDDFEYCEVSIVTRHNGTIKINSRNLCPTKLPWTVGNHYTYDMAINNFVVAAIGKEDVPNKEALNVSSLKESIYKYIDERNAGAPIAMYKWNYDYPENLKLLTENFTIISKGILYGNVYSCLLRTSTMPSSAKIYSQIDMTSKADIKMITGYAALIDKYFKVGNFLFDYYSKRTGSFISFAFNTGHSPYSSVGDYGNYLPELTKIDSTQVIAFWIGETDDSSYCMVFPDDKILVTNHSITTPHGETAPIFPPQDPNASWSTKSRMYYLFNDKGKVLKQGLGF